MPTPTLSNLLIGTWELLSREDRTAAGEIRAEPSLGSNPVALVIFDGRGHFSAQFMRRDRTGWNATDGQVPAPNNSRAQGGYDAYFGTYVVDEAHGSITTTFVGALSQENVGQAFTRTVKVVGDELTIRLDTASPEGEPVVRTLTWRRVG